MAKNGYIHPTRIFKTPEELAQAWEQYKQHRKQEAKEWLKVQYVGKEGDRKTDEPIMPLTMAGFQVFCYKNYGSVHHYFDNKEGLYDEFGVICSDIRLQIMDNQITGGLLGYYNPSITQRLNGLVEKNEQKVITEQPLFGLDDSNNG